MFTRILGQRRTPQVVHRPTQRVWFSVITWSIVLVTCLAFSFAVGCGSGDSTGARNETSLETTAEATCKTSSVRDQIREQLVGVWLGGAYIDEVVLAEKLKNYSPQESEEILRQAQYFAGTIMAIDFKSDGSLINDIEISSPSGQRQREEGHGTWRIAQVADDGFVVEISEQHEDGSVSQSQKVYKFYDDGNHFAVSIPLANLLGECNPLIIFERQNMDTEEVLAKASANSTQR